MPGEPQAYRFGPFALVVDDHQLLQGEAEIPLRPKAFQTLVHLVRRHGHVVGKQELLDRVWPETNVSEAVLTHCIAEVRQALQDDARQPRYLKTVSRAGYRFIAEVTVHHPVGPAPSASPAAIAAARRPLTAIAVLPFANISGDPGNEFFCDGLSEELINGLTQVPALRVVAHSSSFSFKGRDVDAREIGRQLNVGSILEGSVRKTGRRLRISAQLIDANDGYHVWSEQYDRRLEDVFAIQDEISLAILSKVKGSVPGGPVLPRRAGHDLEAYELYLKGRSFWHRRFKGALPRAMECFEQAIERDPGLAVAYTGLADSLSTLGVWGFAPPASVFPRAVALVDQALALEPGLAEGHASRGLLRMFHEWDWAGAVGQLSRAVALNPGNALVRLWNSHALSIAGRWDEAIDEVLLARDLDPLSAVVVANAGWTYHLAGRHERAIEALQQVLAADPRNGMALFYQGYPLAELNRYDEARASFEAALDATGGMPWAAESLAWVHGLEGDRERARALLNDSLARMKTAYVPASAIALVFLGLGEDRSVFEWLDRCVEDRDAIVPWMKHMPCFDRLRPHHRFQEFLQRVGLADALVP